MIQQNAYTISRREYFSSLLENVTETSFVTVEKKLFNVAQKYVIGLSKREDDICIYEQIKNLSDMPILIMSSVSCIIGIIYYNYNKT